MEILKRPFNLCGDFYIVQSCGKVDNGKHDDAYYNSTPHGMCEFFDDNGCGCDINCGCDDFYNCINDVLCDFDDNRRCLVFDDGGCGCND